MPTCQEAQRKDAVRRLSIKGGFELMCLALQVHFLCAYHTSNRKTPQPLAVLGWLRKASCLRRTVINIVLAATCDGNPTFCQALELLVAEAIKSPQSADCLWVEVQLDGLQETASMWKALKFEVCDPLAALHLRQSPTIVVESGRLVRLWVESGRLVRLWAESGRLDSGRCRSPACPDGHQTIQTRVVSWWQNIHLANAASTQSGDSRSLPPPELHVITFVARVAFHFVPQLQPLAQLQSHELVCHCLVSVCCITSHSQCSRSACLTVGDRWRLQRSS